MTNPSWDQLLAWQTHDNVGAWQAVIREGESCNDDSAYRWLYGSTSAHPKLFDSFDDHPRVKFPLPDGRYTTAAGAFQATATTWDDFCSIYGRLPFTPENQRLFAVWCTWRRHALDDVIAGRLDAAIRKCVQEWTSLGLAKRQQEAPIIFAAYGGREASAGAASKPDGAPSFEADVNPHDIEVKPMAPLILPLLEIASGLIPQLGKLFGSGTEVSNRNIAAAGVVADSLVKATEAVNLQDAVERIQNDPQALNAARQAAADALFQIGEAGGGGISAARQAAVSDGDWRKVVFSAPFMLALGVMPLVYAVVFSALLKFSWLAEITSEVRTGVITSVTGLILGSLMGYFYGTSASSAKKDLLK